MYKSPIELFSVEEYAKNIDEKIEKAVYEVVMKVGINVNRDELIKALEYDRNQYEKGYADGKRNGIEWHPYADEKPSEDKMYLVTYHYVNDNGKPTDATTYAEFKKGHFHNVPRVTAWAERPVPYRRESKDETN